MGLTELVDVLAKIGREFDAHGIRWAVGASMMLHRHGLADEPHDLDLFISVDDIDRVESVMGNIGELQSWEENPFYGTKRFLEYHVDGVEVDIIAGFVIKGEDFEFRHDFEASVIEIVEGIRYMTLEEWKDLYRMMGRTAKAEMIEHYLDSVTSAAGRRQSEQ